MRQRHSAPIPLIAGRRRACPKSPSCLGPILQWLLIGLHKAIEKGKIHAYGGLVVNFSPEIPCFQHWNTGAAQLQDSGLPDPEPRGGAPSLGDCTQDPQQGDAPAGECPVSSEKGSGSYAELPTSASRGPSSTGSWPPTCTIAAAFVAPSSSFVSEACKGWVRMRLSPVRAAPETVKASSDEEDRGSIVPAAEAPRVLAIALCHLICC